MGLMSCGPYLSGSIMMPILSPSMGSAITALGVSFWLFGMILSSFIASLMVINSKSQTIYKQIGANDTLTKSDSPAVAMPPTPHMPKGIRRP